MRTMGITPGDAVLVIEHRGEQDIVYNGLVAAISMQEALVGTHGEPAIVAAFVLTRHVHSAALGGGHPVMTPHDVVHISHIDWRERRAVLAYEELPEPIPGVCRYCKCTSNRACPGGCEWLYPERTVCSTQACAQQFVRDNMMRTAGRAI